MSASAALVRAAVVVNADRRGHVDDSFDQFGLLQVRHRGVAPLELVAREAIACTQSGNTGR